MKYFKYFLLLLPLLGVSATIMWYSQQPAATVLQDTMVIAVEKASPQGYQKTTLASLKDYTLNNLQVTNYTIYSTNFWISNSYVSNYVVTNVYNDTYASNFFLTQNYVTNQYATNVTITNWYAPDTYISNFFDTNIYVNDTYVSNYFTTNLYYTTATNVFNYLYVSNAYVTNITARNLQVHNIYADNGVFTNGITNLALTPNTIVQADANKALASVPNGTGALTNDGSGNFGWTALSAGGDQVWTNDGTHTYLVDANTTLHIGTNTYNVVQNDTPMSIFVQNPDSGYPGLRIENRGANEVDVWSIGLNFLLQGGTNDYASGVFIQNTQPAGPDVSVLGGSFSVGTVSKAGWVLGGGPTTQGLGIGIEAQASGNYKKTVSLFADTYVYAAGSTNMGGDIYVRNFNTSTDTSVGLAVTVDSVGAASDSLTTNSVLIVDSRATGFPLIIGRTNNSGAVAWLSSSGVWTANAYVATEYGWSGATNQLGIGEFTYTAYTPCAVTNLTTTGSALLSITNASSSNITFTVHSPIRIPYGETSRSYTITNGHVFFGSFRKGTHGSVFVPRGFYNP